MKLEKLTDAIAIKLTLPAGKDEDFAPDPAMKGFGLRLRLSGNNWGSVPKRLPNGKQVRGDFGKPGPVLLKDARKAYQLFCGKLARGENPNAEAKKAHEEARAEKLTLGVAVARYLKVKKKELRPSSYRNAEYYLNKVWAPLHSKPLTAITLLDHVVPSLEEFSTKLGRPSARAARSNLSNLYVWASKPSVALVPQGHNPVKGTDNPAKDIGPRERNLDEAELATILHACSDDDFGRIVRLLVLNPCRRDEFGALQRGEVSLSTGLMTIPGERTKNGKALVLTLAPASLAILKAIPVQEGQEYFFGSKPGKGFKAWSSAKLRLDNRIAMMNGRPLAAWTLHDLRRSCRTKLSALKVRPDVAELMLGHFRKDVRAVYDKYDFQPEIAAALRKWAKRVATIVEQHPAKETPIAA